MEIKGLGTACAVRIHSFYTVPITFDIVRPDSISPHSMTLDAGIAMG
jgi:hypothetical protein